MFRKLTALTVALGAALTVGGFALTASAETVAGQATANAVEVQAVQGRAAEAARVAAEAETARVAAEAQAEAEAAAAAETARVAAEQAAAVEAARVADEQAAAEAAETEAGPEDGWYDSRGWVSPETAQRALEQSIPVGGDVPGYLRCGTICGEEPTSGELQQQWLEEQDVLNPDGSLKNDPNAVPQPAADGVVVFDDGDSCAYSIRGNCYPSAEAAQAAGEGE